MSSAGNNAYLKERIASLEHHLEELNAIGLLLSTEKDLDRLLQTILSKAREITQADSGSLYLVGTETQEGFKPDRIKETDRESSGFSLRFKLSQNDSIDVTLSEFSLPINSDSIVGYVALTRKILVIDDVYQMNDTSEFSHNSAFDQKTGYHTKSMFVVPMRNHRGELFGVLQLINKKRDPASLLDSDDKVAKQVLPFSKTDQDLVESLASQASVAIANTRLYQDIENLFEGFVRASVLAIESRDPTTSGHSERVATMTCALAEVVDRQTQGRFKDIVFSTDDLRELRYASLLHDFGKIGVREEVLIKAKKLYPHEMELLQHRFELACCHLELEMTQRKVALLTQAPYAQVEDQLGSMDAELAERTADMQKYLEVILQANEPTILEEGAFEFLQEIAKQSYRLKGGEERFFLHDHEVKHLSVRKGSLSIDERRQIESHVTHSYLFLKQIPWTNDLRRIPEIAYAHHEKLNGSGYPRKLMSEQIPLQAKVMTITDIFDALTARDRPYKRAVPVTRALDILRMEVDDGQLDADLYQLFIEGHIYKRVT